MRYFKQYKDKDERFEITKAEALMTLFTTYKDNHEVRSWLEEENYIKDGVINCRYSWLFIEK